MRRATPPLTQPRDRRHVVVSGFTCLEKGEGRRGEGAEGITSSSGKARGAFSPRSAPRYRIMDTRGRNYVLRSLFLGQKGNARRRNMKTRQREREAPRFVSFLTIEFVISVASVARFNSRARDLPRSEDRKRAGGRRNDRAKSSR